MAARESRMSATLALVLLSLSLSACVLVVGEGGDDPTRDRRRDSVRRDADRTSYVSSSREVTLRQRVAADLAADPLLSGQQLTVTVAGPEVTLHGAVDGMEAFARAVAIASGTEGVERVVSRLVVTVR